jgi:hypothetical protein
MQHRDLRDAAVSAAGVVEVVKRALAQAADNESVELEGRLGRVLPDGSFSSDVGDAFGSIVQMLDSYPRWSRITEWQDSEDVFFLAQVEGSSREIRSRVSYGEAGLSVHNIHKRRIAAADLKLKSTDPGCCALEHTEDIVGVQLDARITASLERTVPLEALPPAVKPTGVRLKRRKSYFLASLAVPGETFRFDCTLVWQSDNKRTAEKLQMEGAAPRHEVEVECLLPAKYLESCRGDSTYLALSLILKLLDFAAALNPHTSVAFVPASPPA